MATNESFRNSDSLTLPGPAGTKSGAPGTDGSRVGIALTSEGGGTPTVRLKGGFDLEGTAAASNAGDAGHGGSAGALSVTSEGNTLFGYALATKTAAAAVIPVRIAQV